MMVADNSRTSTSATGAPAVLERIGSLATAALLPLAAITLLPACTPTPEAGNPSAACGPPRGVAEGVQVDCMISGQLPNMLIDPGNPSNTACSFGSFLLFDQSISAPVTLTLPIGDDRRVNARLSGATHRGRLAKASWPGCSATGGQVVTVETAFEGRHVALVDKSDTPVCVFQSLLTLSTFDMSISAGLTLDASGLVRAPVEDVIARRLDLEIARDMNAKLRPSTNTSAAGFVRRAGRCDPGYRAFTGD